MSACGFNFGFDTSPYMNIADMPGTLLIEFMRQVNVALLYKKYYRQVYQGDITEWSPYFYAERDLIMKSAELHGVMYPELVDHNDSDHRWVRGIIEQRKAQTKMFASALNEQFGEQQRTKKKAAEIKAMHELNRANIIEAREHAEDRLEQARKKRVRAANHIVRADAQARKNTIRSCDRKGISTDSKSRLTRD